MLWLMRTAIEMLYPRTSLPGAADCDLDPFLRKYREEATTLMFVGTLAGALVFHLSPLFTVGLPVPAFMLSKRLGDLHAQRITNNRFYLVRQSLFLLKMLAGLCWGADPKVRAAFALRPLPSDPGTWRAS